MSTKRPIKPIRIGMISLGCPKNQVDAEQMLGVLASQGFEITPDQAEAEVIVVNTCGFIESAKEESIEAILDAAKMKKQGKCRALIVAGCLAQRYKDDLAKELPEADAIIGTAEIPKIAEIAGRVLGRHEHIVTTSAPTLVFGLPRVSTTPRHYRYLKIAEGCSNRCSYCAIPLIRGNFTSRPADSILDEAKRLADEGTKELVLLAQDSTQYRDLSIDLPKLLRKLAKIKSLEWVRLMYVYPGKVTDELMAVLADEEKLCRYLDIPVQHIDDKILQAMNRRGTSDDIKRTIDRLRKKVPGIALRTSLITGFPGETDAAFKRLLAFAKEYAFDHLGVFTYSPEEGTPARDLPGQVAAQVAEERLDAVMRLQKKISLKKNQALVGTRQRVIVDAIEDMALIGRMQTQAPEIDGVVYLSETEVEPGEFVDVTITEARDYDVLGKAETRND
ncbi:MAG: 30S ribosomal protein S12 methylthiotransferase RimO [Nitrospirota bacterium]|nr:30S ribosomal protein S12 methylthiotransferase RimO [Nitrospirota bacterium]